MTDRYLDVHIGDDAAVLTLNRPAKLNVMDVATRVLLAQTIRRFGTGDLVRGRIGADEALRIGLLDEIVGPETLVDRAVEVITQWNSDPRTTALHLGLLRPRPEDIEAAFAREDDAARQSWESGAFTEGVDGFWASKNAAPSAPAQSN